MFGQSDAEDPDGEHSDGEHSDAEHSGAVHSPPADPSSTSAPPSSRAPVWPNPSASSQHAPQPFADASAYLRDEGKPPPRPLVVMPVAMPAPKRRGLARWLPITVAVVVLLLGGVGTGLGLWLYSQPAAAASQFCQSLQAQNYGSAYGELSAALQGRYTSAQFRAAATALDGAEGKVTACAQAQGSDAYSYRLGDSTASFAAALTREKFGHLQGVVQLVSVNGAWKIAALDTSLLGANLDALGTLGAFCSAMQTQAYANAYALFDSTVQGQIAQADFTQEAQWRDQIDGTVTACALGAVEAGNTDATTRLTATLTRATLGTRSGIVTLGNAGGAWQISQLDDALQGTPVAPLRVGTAFCAAVSSQQWATAYGLLADDIKQQVSLAQLPGYFTLPGGLRNDGCTPELTTYVLQSGVISYNSTLKIVDPSSGAAESLTMTMYFTGSGQAWLVDGWKFS